MGGRQGPRSVPRWVLAVAPVVLLLAVAAGFAFYVAGRVDTQALQPNRNPPEFRVQVVAAGDGQVTLRHVSGNNDDWARPGILGLEWLGGYGQVNEVISIDRDRGEAVRRFTPVRGTPAFGAYARLTPYAFPSDPADRGLTFEDVRYPAPGGPTPAWLLKGSRDTWAIFVHGKGADRRESLRILPTLVGLGFPVLVINYRNDVEAPGGQSDRYHYGTEEWRDLEAAVAHAQSLGAKDIVLVGYSMGGAIVSNFLYRSERADRVRAVVLDAPMLHFKDTVDFGLEVGGIPGPLRGPLVWFVGLRHGLNWDAADYLERASELRAPVLLWHGTDDDIVPVATSDRLAKARPDLVQYERLEGVRHVRSWNTDPARYDARVREFLGTAVP